MISVARQTDLKAVSIGSSFSNLSVNFKNDTGKSGNGGQPRDQGANGKNHRSKSFHSICFLLKDWWSGYETKGHKKAR
ncbi:hypothetical protein DR864_27170 [Runella rosea]|uniref:Uncharacterized protein n=1 Tax=Runella rosea TaxID=2259595 RepID=A0A344TR83_9BACT|nr:hypothetical protein DR864_27170 [Runella rosea]